jgi:serine phosphatase RsbU (regulator of sigma subunit)
MYSVAKHEVIELVSQTEHSVGSIGMSGIDVNFPRLDFVMDNQDVLVLFTDGVNEYENKSGEQYGKKHLAEVLKTMGTSSAKRILNAILSDINSFSQGVPQQDDITILVIKRNKDVDYIPEL